MFETESAHHNKHNHVGMLILTLMGLAAACAVAWNHNWVHKLKGFISTSPDILHSGTVQFCPYDNVRGEFTRTSCGQWETVVPTPNSPTRGSNLLMQAVHMALLPSGKVLIINGGSNRWQYPGDGNLWPYAPNNVPSQTVLFSNRNPTEYSWANQKKYYDAVNNNGILDPVTLEFSRIGAPPNDRRNPSNPNVFMPNDLFCAGHLHLRDGNVMLNGGTEWSGNGREGAYSGHKSSYIFDWQKSEQTNWRNFDWTQMVGRVGGNGPTLLDQFNPFIYAGDMKHGRWYSEMVSLMDGRLVTLGGHSEFALIEQGVDFNPSIDVFDYAEFLRNRSNADACWKNIPLPQTPTQKGQLLVPYAHVYLLRDGRIFISGSGGSASEPFLLTVGGTRAVPTATIVADAERPVAIGPYSSSLQDPNNPNRILDFGGFGAEAAAAIPGWIPSQTNAQPSNKYQSQSGETGRGRRRADVYTMPTTNTGTGTWAHYPDFMGTSWEHDRGNHMAILLPTKQILISGGGWYQAYGAVKQPLLLTPVFTNNQFTGRYARRFLAPMRMPRLYHGNGILLPDGRVLVAGGNAGNGLLNFTAPVSLETKVPGRQPLANENRVKRIGIVNQREDLRVVEIVGESPAEVWTAEIFSPPYLFIDPTRRAVITDLVWVSERQGLTVMEELNGKQYYLIQSSQDYALFIDNPPTTCREDQGKAVLVLMKLGCPTHAWDSGQRLINIPFRREGPAELAFTTPNAQTEKIAPAFYMLFYVDCRGKPTVSLMVRFDDQANRPLLTGAL